MNQINALRYIDYSEKARLDKEELEKVFQNPIFISNDKTDTQLFIINNTKEIIISFRGSQQIKDWLIDFTAFHVVCPYNNTNPKIKVHKGFITAYKSVRDIILNYLKENLKYNQKVICCGHSLGGALCTLAAVDIQYNVTDRIECYPSGNPMVGNKEFCKSFNKRVPNTLRTYMKKDLVPTMPPKFFNGKYYGIYKHCGKSNPIGSANIFTGIINWIRRRFLTYNALAEITNHSIFLYKKYIVEKM